LIFISGDTDSSANLTAAEIKGMSVKDLEKLFSSKVSKHGIDKFLSLLMEDSNSEQDEIPKIDDEEGVDYVSHTDEDSDADEDDDDDDSNYESEGICSDEDQSSDESIVDNQVEIRGVVGPPLHLHDPIQHPHLHCPPFPNISNTSWGDCDCNDHGMDTCCSLDNYEFFSSLGLNDEFINASNTVDNADRLSNNKLRKQLYFRLFHICDFGVLEERERRRLPNCPVAYIRQIYPSETGDYMGFKEN
jgi:hypothetical protein